MSSMGMYPDHTCDSEWGVLDVYKLWNLTIGLPIETIMLDEVKDFWDDWYWGSNITHEKFVEHMERVQEADLSYPIILDKQGNLLDGAHRLCKARLEGRLTVDAVRVIEKPVGAILFYVGTEEDT